MEDAAASHLQLMGRLSAEQMRRIQDFELRIYAAQQVSDKGGALDTLGASGGPAKLRDSQPGALGSIGVLCQLEAEAEYRSILEKWLPGFAATPSLDA